MSRLIETIRFSGGKPLNIDYHLKRINASRPTWDRIAMLESIQVPDSITHKVRVVYDRTTYSVNIEPYTIRPVRTLKLVTDNNIVYDHKYEDRKALNVLFSRRTDCDDILIVKNGVITDTSYSNIIFRKDDTWFTPTTFLLNGTMRQYLLDKRMISEAPITPANITRYSHFKLINAMLRDEAPESEVLNIR
ncbi:MAG TPA: aminotransferase class IV [Cyclobacteriaceae bacterium]|nr:aminotransferase class IV [Cyclobacteriaceae bacterium]